MRTFSLFALLAIAAALSSVTRLSAQCIPQMNISVYSDGDVSDDGSTVYGYSSSVDSSTLCSCDHSNYLSASWLVLPDGSYVEGWQPGDTSSVSTPTDGVEGSYYATGAESLDCSCYGNFGVAGPGFPILPPPPNITGISDTSTWSNTIYQGSSGYVAIFGTGLTAWGETPTPTVTGDGSVTIGSVSYASDTQVNVSYAVAANAAIGQHTIALQTARGRGTNTVQVGSPPDHVSVLVDQQGAPQACPTQPYIRQMQMQIVTSSGQAITNNPSIFESYLSLSQTTCSGVAPQPSSCAATTGGGTFLDSMTVSGLAASCQSSISQSSGCGYTLTSSWGVCSNGLNNAIWTSIRQTLSNGITVNGNSTQYPVGTQLH